jgi:hypothetical protein
MTTSRWLLASALSLVSVLPSPAAAETVRSGFSEIEMGSIVPPIPGPTLPEALVESLVNPGFETGTLPPWTTDNWSVVTTTPHSGTYAAYDVGNFWIRQDFAPINTGQVLSFSFWAKQPEAGQQIQAYDFFYSDNSFDEFIWFPPDDYAQVDGTSNLRPPGNLLVAIRIWGYQGGGKGPDETWVDDVSLDTSGATPVAATSWGRIKSLYRN